jgi:hypothetical protein
MTRVFLAAGVASLAIAAPALAGPHGQHGGNGGGGQAAFVARGGGGGGHNGGGGGFAPQRQSFAQPRMQRQSFAQPRMQRQSFAAPRFEQRSQRMAMPRMQQRSQRFAAIERPQRSQHMQMRQQRMQTRVASRPQMHANHAQQRTAARQQTHVNRAQAMNRQQLRANRVQQAQNLRDQRMNGQNRMAMRQQMQANRVNGQNRMAMRQQMQANRLSGQNTQQLQANRLNGAQNLLAERQALRPDRIANVGAFQTSRFASMVDTPRMRVIAPAQAVGFIGQPVNTVSNYVTLAALPASVSYLYPPTPDYYYQYGGGYLYQVDRGSSLIDALIPLLAGGFLPGTYLPSSYMGSYVPSYYGLNSFYPASYDYGYGSNVCNRYAYGVVYQVDCFTGMVENVIPTYAGGYGVGQMLPSAYGYYNLPMQYRSMYYPTADYSYWYAPGAIYQYDTRSSLITSVAALMSPGFTVGQPLPMGYNMYNVPMAYRATYYDTPNAWYRYNNGYIYQVDPSTMLVTSIVASLLT